MNETPGIHLLSYSSYIHHIHVLTEDIRSFAPARYAHSHCSQTNCEHINTDNRPTVNTYTVKRPTVNIYTDKIPTVNIYTGNRPTVNIYIY